MTVHSSKLVARDSTAFVEHSKKHGPYALGGKRLLDITLVLLALPFLLPFLVIIGALVAMDGHSPFFRQERVGLSGKRFYMWKFRTMVPNAEAHLKSYLAQNPEALAEWDEKQKLTVDPRITKIGRVLRKYSLDELPQLWNVLIGEMSMVGPRPLLPEEKNLYPGREYNSKRPGITGSWQVSDRQHTSYEDRARFDDDYAKNMSFLNDLKLLWKTVVLVVRDFWK